MSFPPGLRLHVEPVPIASGRATKGSWAASGSLRGDKGFVMIVISGKGTNKGANYL